MNNNRPRHPRPVQYQNISAPDNSFILVRPVDSAVSFPRPAVYSVASLAQRVLSCRLCDRKYHDANDLIGIFSEEGRSKKIAPMMMYTLNIFAAEHDPLSKYICKVCYGHLDCSFKFASTCRKNFLCGMNNIPNLQSQNTFKDEIKKLLTVPAQSLYFNQSTDISDTYNSIIQYLRNPEANPKTFERNLKNNVLNDLNLRNGYTQSSSSLMNVPITIIRPNTSTSSTNTTSSSTVRRSQSVKNRFPSTNAVANKDSPSNAVAINVPSTIGQTIANNVNIDHDYHEVQSSANRFEEDEVICLDDDDSDPEIIETDVNPLNLWMNNDKADNNNKVEKPKTDRKKVNGVLPKRFKTHRRLLSINPSTSTYNGSAMSSDRTSGHSSFSNVASEDVTITPDIPMLNFGEDDGEQTPDPVTSSNQCDVTSNFGIHFLYKADETVDLTSDSPKKTPVPRKRKVKCLKSIKNIPPPPKKKCEPVTKAATIKVMEKKKPLPVSTLSTTKANVKSVGNSTATEKSVVAVQKRYSKRLLLTAPNKTKEGCRRNDQAVIIKNVLSINSHKLGKHSDGGWSVVASKINLPLYQCAICEKVYHSPKIRQYHEFKNHSTLPTVALSATNFTSELENCFSSTEQQEFLIYFELVKKTSNIDSMEKLARRPNLLQALQTVGNNIGSFNCHFCSYTTCRKFILWVHMSACHNIFNSEKKSSTYCILCNRTLNKRIRYLNHINTCIATQLKSEKKSLKGDSSIKSHICYICNANIISNSDLEIHMWNHIFTQRNSN